MVSKTFNGNGVVRGKMSVIKGNNTGRVFIGRGKNGNSCKSLNFICSVVRKPLQVSELRILCLKLCLMKIHLAELMRTAVVCARTCVCFLQ